jgi:hypothetical protein
MTATLFAGPFIHISPSRIHDRGKRIADLTEKNFRWEFFSLAVFAELLRTN